MFAKEVFLRYWLPVLACAVLIFGGSTDLLSTRRTSRFIRPFLVWLKPDISEEALDRIQTVVRKTGHVTEYAFLTILVWRAIRKPVRRDPRPWSWRAAVLAVAATGAYAITDEWHQSFVGTRYSSGADVLIDTLGGVLGICLVWAIWRFRRSG